MNKQNRFLPTTKDEMKQRGWDELDVVFLTFSKKSKNQILHSTNPFVKGF